MCNVRMLAIALLLVSCDGSGCAALAQQGPTLSSVMSRVDVPRLLRCAELDSAKRVARCLGAEALTQGLSVAIEEARRLAESAQLAGNGGAGAADYSDADRLALAAELDAALDHLAGEIAATHRE
jgi:hypothetical protein